MPDVPYPPPPEPTREEIILEHFGRGVRTALTGNPDGRLRRTVLWIILAASLVSSPYGGTVAIAIGLVALVLLALTDQVVELT